MVQGLEKFRLVGKEFWKNYWNLPFCQWQTNSPRKLSTAPLVSAGVISIEMSLLKTSLQWQTLGGRMEDEGGGGTSPPKKISKN